MKTLRLRSHADANGMLELNVPTGMPDTDLDVTVVVQPARQQQAEWDRLVSETAGSISDPSFVRHAQGEFEDRSELP